MEYVIGFVVGGFIGFLIGKIVCTKKAKDEKVSKVTGGGGNSPAGDGTMEKPR